MPDPRERSEQALGRSLLLRDLPPDVLRELAGASRRRTFRRGEVICHQGDPGDTLLVLESGRVKVSIFLDTGDETVLAVLGPGDCFGELALIDGQPRSATVEALEAVESITLRRADCMRLLHESGPAFEQLLATLARMIRRLSDSVADVSFLNLDARLAKKLLALADEYGSESPAGLELDLPVRQEDLASMVGATRSTVNKVLGQFEDQGLIDRRGRHIVIRDAAGLDRKIL